MSGARAHSEVIATGASEQRATDHLARLNEAALEYGERLAVNDVEVLCSRLYFFNRRPPTLLLRQRAGSPRAFEQWLGIGSNVRMTELLGRQWQRDEANVDWLYWWTKGRSRMSFSGGSFKLYVSPQAEVVPICLERMIEVVSLHDAMSFKVGRDVSAMQRPDKIIVYFDSFAGLQDCAATLRAALSGIPAHGVPFTAALDASGLSWGVDPPRDTQLLSSRDADSWRSWVAGRLAAYLLAARRDRSATVYARHFALDRIALDGVNTTTWVPDETWLAGLIRRSENRNANNGTVRSTPRRRIRTRR